MDKLNILWADDEIDLLKPHILFLEGKGYEVTPVKSGDEALEVVKENKNLNAVLLDENMPGLTGLETLVKIKQLNTDLPVIMITKSEEEHIMDDAIGGKIADYLIKPVIPRKTQVMIRRKLVNRQRQTYRNIWPILESSSAKPEGWKGWPSGKKFGFIIDISCSNCSHPSNTCV